MNFDTLLVGSIPLIAVIFGLVEFFKSLGLKGRALTITSLLFGVAFGIAYQITAGGVPATFPGWFEAVIFGLAIGLVASGFYDFANSRWPTIRDGNKPPSVASETRVADDVER